MIKGFDKEAFMSQPIEVEARQETIDLETPRGYAIRRLNEQTIVLHIGDAEYDVRDLIWRLLNAEASMYDMMNYTHGLEDRIRQLEERVI